MSPFFAPSDGALVRDARRARPEAFERLVLRYQRRAYAVARASGCPVDGLEDLVQESFLQAFRGLPRLRSPEKFGAWFLNIVRNLARKELRRPDRIRLQRDLDAEEATAADSLEAREIHDRLWAEVDRLPEETREAVFLYYYEGQSTKEVARALGVTVSTVKNRLQRGRDSLRRKLWRQLGKALEEEMPSERDWRRRGCRLGLLAVTASAAWGGGMDVHAVSLSGTAAGLPASRASFLSLIASGVVMTSKSVLIAVCASLLVILGTVLLLERKDRTPGEREDNPALSRGRQDSAAHSPRPPGEDPGETAGSVAAERLSTPQSERPERKGEPPPPLRVRVVDATGENVPGSHVVAEWHEWRKRGADKVQVVTGRWRLEDTGKDEFVSQTVRGDFVLLDVSAPGLPRVDRVKVEVPGQGLEEPVVVVMEPGAALLGRVEDVFDDNAPVPGTTVGAEDSTASPFLRILTRPAEFFHRAATDDEGRFALAGLGSDPSYWSWLWLEAEGYGRTVIEVREFSPNVEYRIPLYPPTWIAIRVERESGEPVERFEYGFGSFSNWNFDWKGRDVEGGETRHALDHFFRLDPNGLPTTTHTTLGVRVGGRVVTRRVKIPYGEETSVTVRVGTGLTTVAGRALDPSGFPVPEALVTAGRERQPVDTRQLIRWYGRSKTDSSRSRASVVRTDAEGRFRLETHPGTIALAAYHPDFPFFAGEALELRSGEDLEYDVRFPRGAVVAGRVRPTVPDRSGRAVTLGVEPLAPPLRPIVRRPRRTSVTDDAGAFVFEDVAPGTVQLSLEDSNITTTLRVREGERYEVELGPPSSAAGVTVSGRVTAFGQPVEGAGVSIGQLGAARTDRQGVFSIDGIPEGKCLLLLLPPLSKTAPPALRVFDVDAARGMRPLELDASQVKLSGRVLGSVGPVGGARVRAFRPAEDEPKLGSGMVGKTMTTDEGEYEIDGLFLARHYLVVEKKGYLTAFDRWEPTTRSPAERHDVVLRRAGAPGVVRVRPIDAVSGEAVAAQIRVARWTENRLLAFQHGETGEDGRPFEVPRLPDGRYVVHVTVHGDSAYRDEKATFVHEAAIDQELPVRVRPGGSVELSVETKEGVVPPLSTVELLDEDGSLPVGSVETSPRTFRGRILLSGLPPGTWRLRVTAPGHKPATLRVEVRVATVSRVQAELSPALDGGSTP